MSIPYVKLSARHIHLNTPHVPQSQHILNKACHLLAFLFFLLGFPVPVKVIIIKESPTKDPRSHPGCLTSHFHPSQIQQIIFLNRLQMHRFLF